MERIGEAEGKHASTIGYWVKKHGLRAHGQTRFAPRGGLTRERLERLVAEGLTLAEIGKEVDRSIATVRHWLRKYGLSTDPGGRNAARVAALESGRSRVVLKCRRHGSREHHLERSGRLRCTACRSEAVSRRRQKTKEILVAEAGGACRICGYSRCIAALAFHHLDPAEKKFVLSLRGVTRGIDELRREAAKCALLCHNCHSEVEYGSAEVPPKA